MQTQYNDLTLLCEVFRNPKTSQVKVLVRCVCGQEFTAYFHHIKAGKTKSCGSHTLLPDGTYEFRPKKQKEFHHGSTDPAYASYQAMKDRCYNKKNKDYKDYGGRGITVAQEWLDSYQVFLDHIGPRPPDMTIDRINPNGNYEPGNVRWANIQTQNANKRSSGLTKLQRIFGQKNE